MNQNILTILSAALLSVILVWTFTNDDGKQENKIQVTKETPRIDESKFEEVSETDRERTRDFEKGELQCLALNIYHESRSDNFAGRLGVADVVLNRVNSNLFPDTICDVVQQSKTRVNWKGNIVPVRGMCHFSWYCDGLSDEPLEEDAWEDAQAVAEMVLNGGFRGITEGATHYHATYVDPNWINDRGMVPVGRIGEHKFYRWH